MKYRSLIKRISALVLFLCCIPGSLEVSAATALDTESSGQVEWLDSKVTTTKPDNVVIDTTRLTVTLLHEYSDYFETIEENYFNDSRILSIVDTLPPSDTIPELLDLNYFRKILVLDLDVDSESDLDSLVQSLEQRSDVRSVSYSYYYNVSATSTALTGNEIMPLNTQTNFWYDKVNLVNAWNYTQGSPDIKVGVIDASFYSHPHIDDNLWINSGEIPNNSIDDDGNGFIDDYAGFDCENLDGNVYRAPIDDDYADGHGFSYVTPIQLTNYKDTNYYRFTFEYRGNGNYRIHDAISGQYLVAYNANNKIALSLTYSNTDANTWKFQVMENGLFTIVNSADSAKGMRIQTISDTNISYSELAPAYEQDIKQHWSIFYELSE